MNSVVIGSGFGGIAAALRLKAKGHDVTLIEKHPDLGGRARVFKKNGFTYDGGPTVITAPYLINELFELFKKDPKDYIELSPLKIWYQFVFEDNSKFNYSGDETQMKNQIEKINKDDVKGYEKLVSFTKKIFDKGFTELADVPFDKPFVMMQQLPALLKLKSYKSVYSLVSSYIKNEKLRRMLSMHPLLVGGNPFTTTSIYGLILYLEKKWGIHYSMGGTGNIIKGFEKLMNEVGIKIIKGHEVTKIISKDNKITGVQLNNQKNIETLTSFGNQVLPVGEGALASGLEGKGRMLEPDEIVAHLISHFNPDLPLNGKRVLITTGPTFEAIDPVRFIGNHASGKMGFALAKVAAELGADVILVTGPTQEKIDNPSVKVQAVVSADEMFEAVKKEFSTIDIAIA